MCIKGVASVSNSDTLNLFVPICVKSFFNLGRLATYTLSINTDACKYKFKVGKFCGVGFVEKIFITNTSIGGYFNFIGDSLFLYYLNYNTINNCKLYFIDTKENIIKTKLDDKNNISVDGVLKKDTCIIFDKRFKTKLNKEGIIFIFNYIEED